MKYQEFYDFVVKVHSIAKIGLTYSKDPYAIDNYKELNDLSREMLEKFMEIKFDRPNMFDRDIYPTPSISNRTVIVNDKNEILLVRESNSGLWSIPGGWCDLYDSPKTAAYNEVLQEAGVEAKITKIIAVLERTPFKSNKNQPEYVIVFEGNIDGREFRNHCHEILEVRYFPMNQLPEMSRKLSKNELDRIFEAYQNGQTIFD